MADDDFNFRDDLFGDDDDDNLFDDDDLFDEGGDDAFGDYDDFDDSGDLDDAGFELGDDDDIDLDFTDDDSSGRREGGTSRTFILIAATMIIIFIVGIVLLFVAISGGDAEINITKTAIANLNATTEAEIFARQTQQVLDTTLTAEAAATQAALTEQAATQAAVDMTATAIAEANATTQAQLSMTEQVLGMTQTAEAEQTSAALTATFVGSGVTPPPVDTAVSTPGDVDPLESANMTATRLAEIFTTPTPGGVGAETPVGGGPTQAPTAIGNFGLFDDLTGGGGGPGILALMGIGLVLVIIASRMLRTNYREP